MRVVAKKVQREFFLGGKEIVASHPLLTQLGEGAVIVLVRKGQVLHGLFTLQLCVLTCPPGW
jgi:hypothetical protein